jgi:transforming growth factor-beta-induced protein
MKNMKTRLLVLLSVLLLLAACGGQATPAPTAEPAPTAMPDPTAEPTAEPELQSIVEIAVANGSFTTLVAAVEAAGLAETLAGEGTFTVFAPTDEAFAALPEGTVEALLEDPQGALSEILLYHVVDSVALAADVVTLDSVTTLNGNDVTIEVVNGGVVLNGSVNVVMTDIIASNGVIHVIDAVLLPPSDEPTQSIAEIAVENGSFNTLVAALDAAGLVETLSGEGAFTVFAPTDEAFAALPEGTVEALLEDPEGLLTDILLYHVVDGIATAQAVIGLESVTTLNGNDVTIEVVGEGVVLNGSVNVIMTDIMATNGVIHVIDAVLLPPAEEPTQSIAEIAVEAGTFNTLVAALDAAGLVEVLAGEGSFTVFAPTDEAFAALPEGTVEALLEDPEGLLTDILLYHVVDGVAYAEDVVTLESVTTLNGADVTIEVTDGGVVLNGYVNVIVTDIMATNGVIHVIDAVLLPTDDELLTIAEIAIAAGDFETLVAALIAADLADLMADPTAGPFTVFAPTDEAFAALPEGTIEALLADIDALTAILLYHVVDGAVPAETVVTLESATTLAELDVTITVTADGRVFLNDTVEVIVTDIIASNGIIHVIDTVLLPPAE